MLPIPAATIMIMHGKKGAPAFLLVRRHPDVPVLGDVWVFPGGRVADVDRSNGVPKNAFQLCAVRETKEEAGIDLDPRRLVPILQWQTPENIPTRFDTRFFGILLENRPEVVVDGYEIVDHQWLSAEKALSCHRQNEIRLSPPAFVLLSWAGALVTAEKFLNAFPQEPIVTVKPRNIPLDDGSCNLLEGDAGYESGDLNAEGKRNRLWMRDSEWLYEGFFQLTVMACGHPEPKV